jgi:2-iminobutanoate/2-iminopropanoate deaminase
MISSKRISVYTCVSTKVKVPILGEIKAKMLDSRVAEPRKLVYVSGQVAWDTNGEIVGKGDLRVQVTKALENLKIALAAAGATTEDLIKVNYYVVNLKPDQVPIIREVRTKYFSAEHPPASTLVGVTALAREDFLIEIEAVAVLK